MNLTDPTGMCSSISEDGTCHIDVQVGGTVEAVTPQQVPAGSVEGGGFSDNPSTSNLSLDASISSSKETFGQCIDECIENNYGKSYEVAKTFSPLSLFTLASNEAAELVDDRLQKEANRNLYQGGKSHKKFMRGRRQMKTLSQFRRFNVVMAVVGAGAAGFQVGALGYCAVTCVDSEGD